MKFSFLKSLIAVGLISSFSSVHATEYSISAGAGAGYALFSIYTSDYDWMLNY